MTFAMCSPLTRERNWVQASVTMRMLFLQYVVPVLAILFGFLFLKPAFARAYTAFYRFSNRLVKKRFMRKL